MAKGTSIKDALKKLEEAKGTPVADMEKVELYGQCPPIEKMDGALGALKACKHLALSTNSIDKIAGLAGMDTLRSLSLGRNLLKKVEGLDPVADTLEELWLSYNQIEKLTGLEKLGRLRVLYLSNNAVREWGEVERLAPLAALQELLLVGTPLFNRYRDAGASADYRIEVIRRLPQLTKLDGQLVDVEEREAAQART